MTCCTGSTRSHARTVLTVQKRDTNSGSLETFHFSHRVEENAPELGWEVDNKSSVAKRSGRLAKEMKRVVKDHYFSFEKLKKNQI